MQKKSLLVKLLAVVLGLGIVAAGCGNADENTDGGKTAGKGKQEDLSMVRLGVMTGISEHFIALVGQEKGIWEKNGINLQLTEFATGVEAVGAVQTGQLDVAEVMDYGIVNRLGTTAGETNLRIFNLNYESSTDSEDSTANNKFYVNPDKISEPSDLKGKNLSVAIGTVNEYQDACVIEQAGLKSDDVHLVAIEGITANLAVASNGEIDGAWASGTTAEKLLELGWKPMYTATELGLLTRNMGVTSDTFVTEEALAKYIKARDEVVSYMLAHLDEAVGIITDKASLDEGIVRSTIEQNNYQPEFSADTLESLNNLKTWAFNNGNFEEDFELADFIDTTAAKSVYPDRIAY